MIRKPLCALIALIYQKLLQLARINIGKTCHVRWDFVVSETYMRILFNHEKMNA